MLIVSSKNIEYLSKRCFKPVLKIIDNVVSRAVQAYLEENNVDIQLIEQHKHRVNEA